jgi:predicted NBD/HSP70 family sugar kinase
MADVIEARCDLPVIVENDATASAIAELHAGAAASLSHYVYIYVGHGLGAGIIVDGLPFQGAFNNAGEIGLLSWPYELQSANPNGATPFSIEELAYALGRDQQELEAFGVLDALYHERNGILMAWLELNSRRLRILVSMIENMFDPETILVGGRLPSALCASLVDRSYPLLPSVSARKQRQRPRLQVAELGPDAPAIGAALLPVIAHSSPSFRRLSLMRGRSSIVDLEARFDRVAGAMN